MFMGPTAESKEDLLNAFKMVQAPGGGANPMLDALSKKWGQEIADEMADIAVYLAEMADLLGIDLLEAMRNKLAKNAAKYPVEKARGSHKKYTDLE